MKNERYYYLYELRELTESIYRVREAMVLLKNGSYEHKEMSRIYEELWHKRDDLESKIIGEDWDINNYWVI